MDQYSIYINASGHTVVAFNDVPQLTVSGLVTMSAAPNAVTVRQGGHKLITFNISSKTAIKIGGEVFVGSTGAELMEALAPFFFDLEGYQQQVFFDTPVGGDTFLDLNKPLKVEIGANYLLESKCYMKGPDDSAYSCVVESRSFARFYDNGLGVPIFTGTPNTQPVPSLATGGVALISFLVATTGQLFYRVQPNASAPALSCRLLFSVTKF